jgi:acyl-ACP thioesterase
MANQNPTWSDKYFINWHEADFKGDASLTTICNFLQETAWRNAEHLGFGYSELDKNKRIWVVLRWLIKMEKYPRWRDEIILETWPRPPERLFALRDYRIKSMDGELLGAASSTWLVLDADTHRPQKPDFLQNALHLTTDEMAVGRNADNIKIPEGMELKRSHRVVISEIDNYGHVNNARYVEWALNLFDKQFLEDRMIKEFQINFISEATINQEIDLYLKRENEHQYIVVAVRKEDRKNVFAAKLIFTK